MLRHDIHAWSLPPKLVHLVLVNGSYVAPEHRATRVLVEGDVLAIWPPIAGGLGVAPEIPRHRSG